MNLEQTRPHLQVVREHSLRAPSIAFIAHDARRQELVSISCQFIHLLERCRLVATEGTAAACAQELGLEVEGGKRRLRWRPGVERDGGARQGPGGHLS